LRGKFHPEILTGPPSRGVKQLNKGWVGKTSHLLVLNVNISTTVADTFKITINNLWEVAYALSIGTKIDDLG